MVVVLLLPDLEGPDTVCSVFILLFSGTRPTLFSLAKLFSRSFRSPLVFIPSLIWKIFSVSSTLCPSYNTPTFSHVTFAKCVVVVVIVDGVVVDVFVADGVVVDGVVVNVVIEGC